MGLPHFTTFCWCMSLEQGAKVIGFFHLLISVSLTVVCSVFAYNASQLAGTAEDAGDELYLRWRAIAAGVAGSSVVHILLALCLLVCVFKRICSGIRAWVWVMICLESLALLHVVVGVAVGGVSAQGSDMFLSFLEAVLFFGTMLYCILCVNSYYLMLNNAQEMETPNKIDY